MHLFRLLEFFKGLPQKRFLNKLKVTDLLKIWLCKKKPLGRQNTKPYYNKFKSGVVTHNKVVQSSVIGTFLIYIYIWTIL